jgi:hypothetical protein
VMLNRNASSPDSSHSGTRTNLVAGTGAPAKPRPKPPTERKGPRAPLDPYHSHFIFVDAGNEQVGTFGHEIDLRATLEDTLCQPPDGDETEAADCVMILCVVGGGPNTLQTVYTMLQKMRPVVVLAHSGGAAVRPCTRSACTHARREGTQRAVARSHARARRARRAHTRARARIATTHAALPASKAVSARRATVSAW